MSITLFQKPRKALLALAKVHFRAHCYSCLFETVNNDFIFQYDYTSGERNDHANLSNVRLLMRMKRETSRPGLDRTGTPEAEKQLEPLEN